MHSISFALSGLTPTGPAVHENYVRAPNVPRSLTAILLTLTLIRGVGYFAVGEFSRDVWVVTAILFPSMLLGMFIGNHFHHSMSDLAFRRTVACALTVSGLALLIK